MDILLAVNDRDLLLALQRLLQLEGLQVSAAFDGAQAVSAIAKRHFDAAVVDDALTLTPCEKVIRLCGEYNIRTVLLQSGQNSAGADAAVTYPFSPSKLYEELKKILSEK